MSKRDIQLLLEDIAESCEKIISYTKDMDYESFTLDTKTIDAVVRNFEIIGEAANKISTEFKSEHNTIIWRRIIAFRHRIVHEYFGIDYSIIWKITEENIPELLQQIKKLINS